MHIIESGIIELTHNTNPRAVPSTWQIFNEWGWKNLLNPFHWGVATPISPFAPRIGRVWGCGLGSGVRKQMPPLVFAQACSNSNTSSCSRVCKKSAYQHVVHIQNIHIEIRGFNMFQHIWIPPQSQSASPQPQEPSWNSADTRLVLRHVFFWRCLILSEWDTTQMLHVWNIYLHLPQKMTPVMSVNIPCMEHLGKKMWDPSHSVTVHFWYLHLGIQRWSALLPGCGSNAGWSRGDFCLSAGSPSHRLKESLKTAILWAI